MTSPIDLDDGIAVDAALDAADESSRPGIHLKLSIDDVLSCVDESNSLYVYGAPGDSVEAGGGWTQVGRETVDGAVFNVYACGGIFLKVECDIDQSLIGLT